MWLKLNLCEGVSRTFQRLLRDTMKIIEEGGGLLT